MLSRERRQLGEAAVEVTGESALDAAACFPCGLAGGEESLVVAAGLLVVADALERDDVERPVELAVAAAVEAMAALFAARGLDGARAGECGEGSFASHSAAIAARDEQLRGADRSHAALLEQTRCELGDKLSERALYICDLSRESLDATAEPLQDAVRDRGARPQPGGSTGESVTRERSQTRADGIGSGDKNRAQLVQGRGPRLHRAAALEQQQPQLLATAPTARKAQPLTAEQPAGSKRRVDQIALPSRPLPTPRTLALEHVDASTREEAGQPRAIAPGALDRERRHPELLRPREQASVARDRRGDLAAVELSAERVKRYGDVDLFVGVDTDRHRPLHDLASRSSRWSTGLDRAVSGKGRTLLSGHRPVERNGGGRQVGFKAPVRQHG